MKHMDKELTSALIFVVMLFLGLTLNAVVN